MPVADNKTYCRMIDHALEKKFVYPAVNVTSLTTANGVLKELLRPDLCSEEHRVLQESAGVLQAQSASV